MDQMLVGPHRVFPGRLSVSIFYNIFSNFFRFQGP